MGAVVGVDDAGEADDVDALAVLFAYCCSPLSNCARNARPAAEELEPLDGSFVAERPLTSLELDPEFGVGVKPAEALPASCVPPPW
jgi:hypothetical protein